MHPVILQQPRRVFFGSGCSRQSGEELVRAGVRRVFVVSSPTVARTLAPSLLTDWRARGLVCEIYDAIACEPDLAMFGAALTAAQEFAPDAVVGLGGGSPLDVAKLVAALLDGRQRAEAVFGIGLLAGRACWLACIPTTAGTGSEVSPNAILLDAAAQLKKGVISPHLVPDAAFLDPDLTLGTPPAVTAATGLDAMVHCMEAYANKNAHPVVDDWALRGTRLIAAHLARAVADGGDREARAQVMLGAYYGGLCLAPVNTAAVHALAYPLGGRFRIAHGVANSLLVAPVFAFNLPAMPSRYADLALALGVAPAATPEQTAQRGLDRLRALARACGLPASLRAVGVTAADLPGLAREAMTVQRLLKNNPREVTEPDALRIYQEAL